MALAERAADSIMRAYLAERDDFEPGCDILRSRALAQSHANRHSSPS